MSTSTDLLLDEPDDGPLDEGPRALSPRELGRWAWRQLTSMRTALALLLLLALGAVPGSIVPQAAIDSSRLATWQEAHPTLTPIYERLGLFHVYSSVWFGAIYVLLMVSLVGCIVPRCRVYWRAFRQPPPATPARLDRLPESRRITLGGSPDQALAAAREALSGYRLRDLSDSVAAEKGHLREAGNLLFHLSILVVLGGFAYGSLFGFKGGLVVVTGDGFSNTITQYDDFAPGSFFAPSDLKPFSFTLEKFNVDFITSGRSFGAARNFWADLRITDRPGATPITKRLAVNHPLSVDGTDIFLIGHGYAPHITVRDGSGKVSYSGPSVFLPEGTDFRSFGVVKVPDATPSQLGLEGEFYPTYAFTHDRGAFTVFPDAMNPAMSLLAYRGDLGMDSGRSQSVYVLDKTAMKPILKPDGKPVRLDLKLGETEKLPDGLGTVSFDGLSRFVKLQISDAPGSGVALGGTLAGLAGLMASLFVRPRRLWVRASEEAGRTVVQIGGLDRSSGGDLAAEIDRVSAALAGALPVQDEENR